MRSLWLKFLLLSLFSLFGLGAGAQNQPLESEKKVVMNEPVSDIWASNSSRHRSLGERMVDFIKDLLGEKQKPIDESLIRDEQ